MASATQQELDRELQSLLEMYIERAGIFFVYDGEEDLETLRKEGGRDEK